jgi:hypothetical protein
MSTSTAPARTRALRACSFGAILLVATACADRAAAKRAEADSSLARDLALAGAQTSEPIFQDTAVAPAPEQAGTASEETSAPRHTRAADRPEPRIEARRPIHQREEPAPPPMIEPEPTTVVPAPVAAMIRAPSAEFNVGTGVDLTSGSKVCTATNMPGDKIVATVNSEVTGTNGAVIPAGSSVVLEVASVTPGKSDQPPEITFRVRSVMVNGTPYNASADVATTQPLETSAVAGTDPNGGKKKVIGGAIVGAILGQMIGHDTKGTIIGAAAGAATGAAISHAGQVTETCLPAGAPLHMTLNAPLVIS